jgi:hypothetical protein
LRRRTLAWFPLSRVVGEGERGWGEKGGKTGAIVVFYDEGKISATPVTWYNWGKCDKQD